MYKPGVHNHDSDHLRSNRTVANEQVRNRLAYIAITEWNLLSQCNPDQVRHQDSAKENYGRLFTAFLDSCNTTTVTPRLQILIHSPVKPRPISPQHTEVISQFYLQSSSLPISLNMQGFAKKCQISANNREKGRFSFNFEH